MGEQLANMKDSADQSDQRVSQAEKFAEEANAAWQDATTRASEAEKQAREFETIASSLQEQLQVQQQLMAPERLDIPTAQVAGNPTKEPVIDESMKNIYDTDTEMYEVNRTICYTYCTSSSVHRDRLAMINVLRLPNPCDLVDLRGVEIQEIQDQVLDQE